MAEDWRGERGWVGTVSSVGGGYLREDCLAALFVGGLSGVSVFGAAVFECEADEFAAARKRRKGLVRFGFIKLFVVEIDGFVWMDGWMESFSKRSIMCSDFLRLTDLVYPASR